MKIPKYNFDSFLCKLQISSNLKSFLRMKHRPSALYEITDIVRKCFDEDDILYFFIYRYKTFQKLTVSFLWIARNNVETIEKQCLSFFKAYILLSSCFFGNIFLVSKFAMENDEHKKMPGDSSMSIRWDYFITEK